jgi:predicted O-methyltransferase YrrM
MEEGGYRSLVFSKLVKDSNGKEIGRESAGMQSTVHCAESLKPECLPADLSKPVPTCSEVGQTSNCRCATSGKDQLKLPYQQNMANQVLKLCSAKAAAKQPLRVLMFGLGGGAVPMHIQQNCEAAEIESVESDARVALIAQRLLGFTAGSKNKVEIADGEEAADRHVATHPWPEGPHYDVVLVDCFDSESQVAHSCRSERFIHAVHTVLASDGHLFQHLMEHDMKQLMPMYQATFGEAFTDKQLVTEGQYLIIAKTHANHPGHAN